MTGIIISKDEKNRIGFAISDIRKIIREGKCVGAGDFYEFSKKDLECVSARIDFIEFLIGN